MLLIRDETVRCLLLRIHKLASRKLCSASVETQPLIYNASECYIFIFFMIYMIHVILYHK